MKKQKTYFQYILLFVLISQFLSIILAELVYILAGNREVFNIYEESDSIYWILVESVILAPVLESGFMFLLIEVCWYILSKSSHRSILTIIVVGALFGALHFYNPYYIFVTTIIGGWYAFAYLYLKSKYAMKRAFWGLVLIHALDNLITIVWDYSKIS